jgi:hypothetical protein
MSKNTVKQVVIPVLVVVLLAGASMTVHASTDEPVHAYTTTASGVKTGFGYGLLAVGVVAMLIFVSRSFMTRTRR